MSLAIFGGSTRHVRIRSSGGARISYVWFQSKIELGVVCLGRGWGAWWWMALAGRLRVLNRVDVPSGRGGVPRVGVGAQWSFTRRGPGIGGASVECRGARMGCLPAPRSRPRTSNPNKTSLDRWKTTWGAARVSNRRGPWFEQDGQIKSCTGRLPAPRSRPARAEKRRHDHADCAFRLLLAHAPRPTTSTPDKTSLHSDPGRSRWPHTEASMLPYPILPIPKAHAHGSCPGLARRASWATRHPFNRLQRPRTTRASLENTHI